jgi:MFS family permease
MNDPSSPGRGGLARFYPWYMLAILMLIYAVGSIDRLVLSVVVEPIKHEFHLKDAQIGLLGGLAFSAPFAIASLPVGWLIDRLNRRVLLGVIVAVWSGLTMTGAAAGNFAALLLARVGVGGAEAGAQPASLSIMADLFPPKRRTTALSIFSVGTALGNIAIFLIGGLVLMKFGWRAVFFVAGIPGLLLAILVMFSFKEPERGRYDGPDGTRGAPVTNLSIFATLKMVLKKPAIMHGIAAHTLATGVQFSVMIWVVSFLVRIHGLAPHAASIWVGSGVGLIQAGAGLLVGPFADRFSKGKVSRLALVPAAATIGCFVMGIAMCLAPTTGLALAALFVEAFFVGAYLGPSYSLMVSLAPANARGSTLAVLKLVSMLIGNGALAYVTGAVSDAVGGPASIQVAIVVTLVGYLWAAFHYYMSGRAAREGGDRKAQRVQPAPATLLRPSSSI